VDETDPLAKQTETREDGLDNDLAAHINSKMADLALSSVEKQVKTRVGCSDLFALIQEVHIKLCSHCFLPPDCLPAISRVLPQQTFYNDLFLTCCKKNLSSFIQVAAS
jgi:nitrate reductase beta subunit